MKPLNITQPLMMMVVGIPGAGKSFFSRQFSEMFSMPTVSFDRLRFELFAEPNFGNDENELVKQIAGYFIEELFKTNRSFAIDGGCNGKVDRISLRQIAKKSDYEPAIIWVQADPETCRARALKRNPEKRVDDQYSPSLDEKVFDSQLRRFTPPTRESHIVISGKHTYNTQAKIVLRKLVVAREAEANTAHRQETNQTRQSDQPSEHTRRSLIIR